MPHTIGRILIACLRAGLKFPNSGVSLQRGAGTQSAIPTHACNRPGHCGQHPVENKKSLAKRLWQDHSVDLKQRQTRGFRLLYHIRSPAPQRYAWQLFGHSHKCHSQGRNGFLPSPHRRKTLFPRSVQTGYHARRSDPDVQRRKPLGSTGCLPTPSRYL